MAIDDKDWDGYGTLFTDDARFDVTGAFDGGNPARGGMLADTASTIGGVAMAALLARTLAGMTTIHSGGLPLINFTGNDKADAIWPVEDWVWVAAASERVPLHGFGRYYETFTDTRDDWHISRLGYRRTFYVNLSRAP